MLYICCRLSVVVCVGGGQRPTKTAENVPIFNFPVGYEFTQSDYNVRNVTVAKMMKLLPNGEIVFGNF